MIAKYTQMQTCQGESVQKPRWAPGSDEGLSATLQMLCLRCARKRVAV
jgi:hypothetical protein